MIESTLSFMRDKPITWAVSGGWAVDLHLGRQTREHHDIEVAVFYDEQDVLLPLLADCTLLKLQSGKSSPMNYNDRLSPPAHQIQIQAPLELELLFNLKNGPDWCYRRNPLITRPLHLAILQTKEKIQYLAPEIVLLYKSTHARPQDLTDRKHLFPLLSSEAKDWLHQALATAHPDSCFLKI